MSLADRLAAGPPRPDAARRPVRARRRATRAGDPARPPTAARPTRSPTLKRRCTRRCCETLGPKLYDARLTQAELEQQGPADPAGGAGDDETPLTVRGPRPDRPGGRRRHPRLRAARAVPARPGHHRDHGQRPRPDLRRARRPDLRRSTASSPTRRTCAARSTRSSARVGRRVDESSPMVDARLPDGSRVNAIIPPLALDGSMLTIRKFAADPFTVRRPGRASARSRAPVASFLAACVRGRLNILVSRRHRLRQDDDPERAVVVHPRATSASSPSRTPPSCSCTRSTCCGWSPGRRTSRARARSRSATWSATRCACGPTASSSARSATPPRSTCCRR